MNTTGAFLQVAKIFQDVPRRAASKSVKLTVCHVTLPPARVTKLNTF